MKEETPQLNIGDYYIPDYIFTPNAWSEAFLCGLDKIDVTNKRILELGIGSGVIAIALLNRNIQSYVGSDINEKILQIAKVNINKHARSMMHKVQLIKSDMFNEIPTNEQYDIICGCLPQLPVPYSLLDATDDSIARYYNSNDYPSKYNIYGLGLYERALIESRSRLTENGSVVFIVHGRFGKFIVSKFFRDQGYIPHILLTSTSQHFSNIPLDSFIQLERQGVNTYFYKDVDCRERISAVQAEDMRLQNTNLYYQVFVVQGKIME